MSTWRKDPDVGKKKQKKMREALVIRASWTRQERVLAALELAWRSGRLIYIGAGSPELNVKTPDGWVDGWALCHPAIGGSEGLRRVRELRALGHEIEMRPHPVHGRTTRQYRLTRPETLF